MAQHHSSSQNKLQSSTLSVENAHIADLISIFYTLQCVSYLTRPKKRWMFHTACVCVQVPWPNFWTEKVIHWTRCQGRVKVMARQCSTVCVCVWGTMDSVDVGQWLSVTSAREWNAHTQLVKLVCATERNRVAIVKYMSVQQQFVVCWNNCPVQHHCAFVDWDERSLNFGKMLTSESRSLVVKKRWCTRRNAFLCHHLVDDLPIVYLFFWSIFEWNIEIWAWIYWFFINQRLEIRD